MLNKEQIIPAVIDNNRSSFRNDGRLCDEIRDIRVVPSIFPQAAGSVLLSIGNTSVLCSITRVKGVPSFLRGTGNGWLTAEYAMLPAATGTRSVREASVLKRNGRSVEISRLIGRVLRTAVNLEGMGEYTIHVDCDVLNADGGTRAVAITGSSYALALAQSTWLTDGTIKQPFVEHTVAAISVGVVNSEVFLDLNCAEDQAADADFTFVFTQLGDIIEMHGTAERAPVSWMLFEQLRTYAIVGIASVFADLDHAREGVAHAARPNPLGLSI